MWIQRLFFITVLILIAQGIIYKKWGLKNIRYSRFFDVSSVVEGEEIQMIERIANLKLLPVPWVRIQSKIDRHLEFSKTANLQISHGEYHSSIFSLMPFMQIVRKHKITCTKRGCYDLNTVSLTCGDLFAVGDRNFKDLQINARLLVYPRLLPLEEIPLPSHSWRGDITVRRWIVDDPFMIAGVREYQYGDPLNRVNWSATARAGNLQVHKLDFTADTKLMILLNVDIKENQYDILLNTDCIEKGISYGATMAQYAITQGIETGFGTNGMLIDNKKEDIYISPQNSQEHLHYIFETMAKLRILRKVTFYTYLREEVDRARTNTDYLIITAYLDEQMEEYIEKLKEQGNAVEVLWLENDQEEEMSMDEGA